MARDHPRDDSGRVLPHAWWPSDRQAPGELEFVRRFCNSINRENGAERFATADSLDRWLVSEGAEPVRASPSGLARVIRLREALHLLVVANATRVDDSGAWDELVAVADDVEFRLSRSARSIELRPTGSGLDLLIGRILGAVLEASRTSSWSRLKACRNCHWVVFDPSKNHSSRWCSMTACGGRHNAREYRRRTRSAN
jgi:predicted RNA-binding Zn ribbon-like protein